MQSSGVLLDIELGIKMREQRLNLGWSAEFAASLYGELQKGIPITRKAYLRMEEGYLPKSPKRRMILAGMLGLAPAIMLGGSVVPVDISEDTFNIGKVSRKAIDLDEYHAALLSYWKNGYKGLPEEALRDIYRRTRALHDKVLYVSSQQKEEMKQLLCGFHIRFAHIAREQGFYKQALDRLNNAIILAHEEHFTDLEAAALHGRGSFYFDRGDLQLALKEFQLSLTINSSAQIKGCTLALMGFTQARLSQNEVDRLESLRHLDESERLVRSTQEDSLGQVGLTLQGYYLFRARALMGSPIKKLHGPDEAGELVTAVEQLSTPTNHRHYAYRQTECNIVQSQIYADKGYFPIATTLASDALDLMSSINTDLHLPAIVQLHDSIRSSSYGNNEEVARLGVQIMRAKFPKMFN